MKIVIEDQGNINLGDINWGILSKYGSLSIYDSNVANSNRKLAEILHDAEIAVLNQRTVTIPLLEECKKLRLINITSTGYEHITPEILLYAKQHGRRNRYEQSFY